MRERVGRILSWPYRTWKSSLAFRAVLSTLAVTLAFWTLAGIIVVDRVVGGLAGVVPGAERSGVSEVVRWAVQLAVMISLPPLGIAIYLISLQIVRPLRTARRAAEGLASGDLDRRMRVEGPEDSAALARSINHMAAELNRRLRDLEAMGRQQNQFVSDVAHELRTPLTTVRMAADVFVEMRDELSPVMGRSAELLSREVDRFEDLLNDLLDLSRIDAGAAIFSADETELVALVADEVAAQETLAEAYGCDVVLDAPVSCLAQVDASRVRRVLSNLLTNAIEHGEGRPVEVHVRCSRQAVAIAVRDHGVGLSEAEQENVFKRFWRADPSRYRAVGGTGLGLAISLENAELHGGSLDVWGRPGGGAQFRLLLPLEPGGEIGTPPWPRTPVDSTW